MNSNSSNMKNKKMFLSPSKTEQFSFSNHRNIQKPAVPVGPRFQAELPTFIGSVYKKLDTSCWLGTKMWPVKSMDLPKLVPFHGNKVPEKRLNPIGKGRADICSCQIPGSSACVKTHVAEEKMKLQIELGPVFWEWKFSEMGEGASWNWTLKEKQKFDSILKMKFLDKNDGFFKNALKALPNKKREAIISYYFNIIVPKHISKKIKSGRNPIEITTDDDDDMEETSSNHGRSRKKSKTKSRSPKRRYLTGVR